MTGPAEAGDLFLLCLSLSLCLCCFLISCLLLHDDVRVARGHNDASVFGDACSWSRGYLNSNIGPILANRLLNDVAKPVVILKRNLHRNREFRVHKKVFVVRDNSENWPNLVSNSTLFPRANYGVVCEESVFDLGMILPSGSLTRLRETSIPTSLATT